MLVKVLIADDISEGRKLERRLPENPNEIDVIGEAADAPQTIRLIGEPKPDVVVMDLNMPGDGFAA
jgi:YesN/AraC family two-component response regulator